MVRHHPVFGLFPVVESEIAPGFVRDSFLGTVWRAEYFPMPEALGRGPNESPVKIDETAYPDVDSEYFEWIDLLESVALARDRFVYVELGAGFGRWSIRAAAAARSRGLEPKIVAVEADAVHFLWLEQTLRDNGIRPQDCCLYRAIVGGEDAAEYFLVEQRQEAQLMGSPAEWYGQSIWVPLSARSTLKACVVSALAPVVTLGRYDRDGVAKSFVVDEFGREVHRTLRKATKVCRLGTVSLAKVLASHGGTVDLVDLDIQGAEADVLTSSPQALEELVKRVHVGTHSRDVESRLRDYFANLGWTPLRDLACNAMTVTEWGPVHCQDGVQTWVNPRFADVSQEQPT